MNEFSLTKGITHIIFVKQEVIIMATLQEAIEIRKIHTKIQKRGIADKLLGKFKGIIPNGKTSTQFIKELRESLYDKIQF